MNKFWYHGTLDQNIAKFNSFAHFGSRSAACDAAAKKYYESLYWPKGKTKHYHVGIPGFYKVRVELDDVNIITLKDWGSSDIRGIIYALSDYFSEKKDCGFNAACCKFMEMNSGAGKNTKFTGVDLILDVLNQRSIQAVKYLNAIEGHECGYSLCIIDPSVIHQSPILEHHFFEVDEWALACQKEESDPRCLINASGMIGDA